LAQLSPDITRTAARVFPGIALVCSEVSSGTRWVISAQYSP